MTTLIDLARHAAQLWPDHDALHFDATGETLSFAEFDARTNAIASGLLVAGIAKGDRVAVWSANTCLFPLAWFGILKAGGIMVPLNIAYGTEDARHLLERAAPRAAFCDADRVAPMQAIADYVSSLEILITDSMVAMDGWRLVDDLASATQGPLPELAITPDDVTNIQFTSGSSGLPKGCMLPHRYWVELARAVDQTVITLAPQETMLTAQVFSYLDPQWAFTLTLMTGARLVVLERFRPSELWDRLAHHEAIFFYCLAAMPLMLLSCAPSTAERLHRLRAIMCSAIPSDRHLELEERFNVPWLEAYGATETGSDLGVTWADHLRTTGTGTIGKALPHREATIVDDTFRPVAPGEIGEMLVRGPAMMRGYWREPQATADAFQDGWFRTGDLARVDTDGFHYLVGRLKDTIRRAGENIAAAEVESVLHQHPAVVLAACIAVPDPIRNEEIKVFVVRREDVAIAELVAFLETRLARFKIPRFWEFISELPMTPSERVAKPRLSRSIEDGVFDRQAAAMA